MSVPIKSTRFALGVLAAALSFLLACSRKDRAPEEPNSQSVAPPIISQGDPTAHATERKALPTDEGTHPQFSDYPAGPTFAGFPAVAKLTSKRQRMFRSQFRFETSEKPNFAGEYKIVEWGCGSPCLSFAIADLRTGAVYDPPFDSIGPDLSQPGKAGGDWGLVFQPDSRLLIAKGCPNERCGTYYYEWTGRRLRLVRVVPYEQANVDEDD